MDQGIWAVWFLYPDTANARNTYSSAPCPIKCLLSLPDEHKGLCFVRGGTESLTDAEVAGREEEAGV